MEQSTYRTTVQVAQDLRRDLKVLYPAIKFQIHKRSHNCLHINWAGGPSWREMYNLVEQYTNSNGLDEGDNILWKNAGEGKYGRHTDCMYIFAARYE
jgi:hypothetical protein